MRILHIVPGLSESGNGIAVAAKLIARGQREAGDEVRLVEARQFCPTDLFFAAGGAPCDEAWVHSLWTPPVWRAGWQVLKSRAAIGLPRLVRMTHGCLDPLRLEYHGWKKRLVSPIERWLLRRTDRIVATCEAERGWNRQWLAKRAGTDRNDAARNVVVDLKSFFARSSSAGGETPAISCGDGAAMEPRSLRVLYLGRRHPLKGVGYLERAVRQLNAAGAAIELRIVSDHHGEELERDWEWCDVLCLPTLSENFGLVVAEALARGKRVITTDGAPAWEAEAVKGEEGKGKSEGRRILYLRGFRSGTDAVRVQLLAAALKGCLSVILL